MRVLGLAVATTFPVPGLPPQGPAIEVLVERSTPWWDPSDATVLSDVRFADDRPAFRVDAGPPGTWRFWGHGHGEAVVLEDGARVCCAFSEGAPIARLLHGQVLPFLAGVRGFEVLHACAVVVGGQAIVVCAPSGTGKSTVLRALLDRGAGFLADDTVAVDDALAAWAGPGVIGPDLEAADVAAESCAVRTVVVLSRGGEAVALEPLHDPRVLLAQGYDALPRSPERQVAGLDRLSRLAGAAQLLSLRVPEGGAGAAADALLAR